MKKPEKKSEKTSIKIKVKGDSPSKVQSTLKAFTKGK